MNPKTLTVSLLLSAIVLLTLAAPAPADVLVAYFFTPRPALVFPVFLAVVAIESVFFWRIFDSRVSEAIIMSFILNLMTTGLGWWFPTELTVPPNMFIGAWLWSIVVESLMTRPVWTLGAKFHIFPARRITLRRAFGFGLLANSTSYLFLFVLIVRLSAKGPSLAHYIASVGKWPAEALAVERFLDPYYWGPVIAPLVAGVVGAALHRWKWPESKTNAG
jgi:hypothetical protein